MDKEKFLESGLLQQYALGLTDEEESAKVEEYLRAYPEVRNELHQMHDALNSYAKQLKLPEKENIDESIAGKSEIKSEKIGKNQIIRIRGTSLLFLVLSAAGLLSTSIYFYAQNLILQHELETHQAKIAQMGENFEHRQTEQLPLIEELHFIEHELTQKIMVDTAYSPIGRAVVYWNPLQKKAMIQLLDYRSDMRVDELYLIDLASDKSSLIAKLEQHSNKLQPIPFFPHYHHLSIDVRLPNEYAVSEAQSMISQ